MKATIHHLRPQAYSDRAFDNMVRLHNARRTMHAVITAVLDSAMQGGTIGNPTFGSSEDRIEAHQLVSSMLLVSKAIDAAYNSADAEYSGSGNARKFAGILRNFKYAKLAARAAEMPELKRDKLNSGESADSAKIIAFPSPSKARVSSKSRAPSSKRVAKKKPAPVEGTPKPARAKRNKAAHESGVRPG